MTAAAVSIVSCDSKDRSSSHQSQRQDNGKATQDDAKDTQEGFGKSTPNPAKTASYALHALLPLASTTFHPTSAE
jgi:hypothetical protein